MFLRPTELQELLSLHFSPKVSLVIYFTEYVSVTENGIIFLCEMYTFWKHGQSNIGWMGHKK